MNTNSNFFEDSEDLNAMAPKLSKIERKNAFEVPEGYFDSLPSKIQERCVEQANESFLDKLFLLVNPKWIASLTMIVFLLGLGMYVSRDKPKEIAIYSQETMAEEDFYDMDEALIVEAFTDEDMRSSGENQDAHINYLIEHEIDETVITDEF